MYRLSRCVPLAHEDKTFQDAHHPAIKARQRVPLSRTNLLHQVRHLMAPQLRASSIDLVVEPIALRGQMREVVILEVEDNGTGIPPRCTRSLRRWSADLSLPARGVYFGGNQCAGPLLC
jgi:hypothetical protein